MAWSDAARAAAAAARKYRKTWTKEQRNAQAFSLRELRRMKMRASARAIFIGKTSPAPQWHTDNHYSKIKSRAYWGD